MGLRTRCAVLLSLCLVASGCVAQPEGTSAAEDVAATRRAIVDWLECSKCTYEELDAVVGLGEVAVSSLAATLEGGPSPASLELHRRWLVQCFHGLVVNAPTGPTTEVWMTEEESVGTSLDAFVALYRVRSAIALGEIGGETAERSLLQATKEDYQEVVRAAVERALGKLRDRE